LNWSAGLTESRAELGEWCKQVAPSTALRKWYDHHPERFEEFSRRYRPELEDSERVKALQQHLWELAKDRTVTLLTATSGPEISEAVVLADLLRGCLRAARADSRPRRWYGTTIGDARAGSPAGQRQRCSGDVKHQRRYGCGAEEIAPRARHRGGRPRGWTAATTPGEARPPAGSCPSVDCGLRAFAGTERHTTPHLDDQRRPAPTEVWRR
jgi:uncharacterized protein YeaO (DUF488 family)